MQDARFLGLILFMTAAPAFAQDADGEGAPAPAAPSEDAPSVATPPPDETSEPIDEAPAADDLEATEGSEAPENTVNTPPDEEVPAEEPEAAESSTTDKEAPDAEGLPAQASPSQAPPSQDAAGANKASSQPPSSASEPEANAADAAADKADKKAEDDAANAQMTAAMGPGMASGGRSWVFRGSAVRIRNRVAARSFIPNLDLTYNPEVSTTIAVMPTVWYGNSLNFSAYVDVTREWTQNDFSTYAGEFLLSDIFLSAGAFNFYKIPYLDIGLSANVTGQIPTSKFSWAGTMLGGVNVSGGINRFFPVLGGLILRYNLSGSKFFHRFTTGENGSSLEHGGCVSIDVCGIYASSGLRNVEFSVSNQLGVTFLFTNWLGVSVNGWVINQRLYPLVKQDPTISYRPEDPTGTLGIQNWRHNVRLMASAFLTPHPAVTFIGGVDTFHPQLAPDGRYRIPGFNRFTVLYADMLVNFGGVASLFFD